MDWLNVKKTILTKNINSGALHNSIIR